MTLAQSKAKAQLLIERFEVNVRLGWPEIERQKTQPVAFDVLLEWENPPEGCFNDQLDGTVCYDVVCTRIKNLATSQEFKLIEYLCQKVFTDLSQALPKNLIIGVKLIKLKPPVNGLKSSQFVFKHQQSSLA